MDPDIDELKELANKTLALAQDTNNVVHSMRRAARWGYFFQIIWWTIIIAASGVTLYYLQPYIMQVEELYKSAQSTAQQGQGYVQQIGQYIGNLGDLIPQMPTSSVQ